VLVARSATTGTGFLSQDGRMERIGFEGPAAKCATEAGAGRDGGARNRRKRSQLMRILFFHRAGHPRIHSFRTTASKPGRLRASSTAAPAEASTR